MKNYLMPICFLLFIILVLISCKKQEVSKLEVMEKPSDRGKIDDTRPPEKVEDGDIVGRLLPWDIDTNTPITGDTLYFKVKDCDIPCSFTRGWTKEGDYVKFKKKGNSDTVEIKSYEYREQE